MELSARSFGRAFDPSRRADSIVGLHPRHIPDTIGNTRPVLGPKQPSEPVLLPGMVIVALRGSVVVVQSFLQSFIDTVPRIGSSEDLAIVMEQATRDLGFDYYALVHHVELKARTSDELVAISSYPDAWIEEYINRGLSTVDPIHLASHRTPIGFQWKDAGDLIDITQAHRQIREDTIRAGIEEGYTVPANIPGEANGSCSFAMRRGRRLPDASIAAAQYIGLLGFNTARNLVLARSPGRSEKRHLTTRQLECLILFGRGCGDKEIGRQLGISRETVIEHMVDARRRYGGCSRRELLNMALFEGKIALADLLTPH